jgi:hypothetical protein
MRGIFREHNFDAGRSTFAVSHVPRPRAAGCGRAPVPNAPVRRSSSERQVAVAMATVDADEGAFVPRRPGLLQAR